MFDLFENNSFESSMEGQNDLVNVYNIYAMQTTIYTVYNTVYNM